ncbi:MAG: hypothetical protein NXH95_04030 [Pseudomonadaceae bacterium]|nr:hypothetical protein [Pseudomonadaceae bacterium]
MSQPRLFILALTTAITAICAPGHSAAMNDSEIIKQNLATAEDMIDAFYSFDPEQLSQFLTHAEQSAKSILYYQGWAEGGNYKIVKRGACKPTSNQQISCAITVEDDPVMALQTDFKVTDTFTLTFEGTHITAIETSSNDQPVYYEARDWVLENMPEIMDGPCQGFFDGGSTPGDCARAMTEGYRQFYAAQKAQSPIEPADTDSASFIPDDFSPPVLVEGNNFKLVPLGPELVKIDYDAYMSSIEHLQKTFTRSTSWPTTGITDEDAMQDMLNEQRRFQNRESFAYAVLTPDGKRERGCIYVQPSTAAGFDAVVKMWVTQSEYDAGFDAELYAWATQWISEEWPFEQVAYPGRAIAWDEWDSL